MVSSAGTRAPTKASMITKSAYPSRSSAMPRRPSVPRTLIPLRAGSGRCRRTKAVSSMSGSSTTWAEVGRVAATYRGKVMPAPPTWTTRIRPRLGHAVEDIGQPLHVVELQPQWIVKVDVGLVRATDAERESSWVGQIRHQ